jgi:hypothetical protein
MKYYKDSNNNVWAFESDGSQDNIIPSGLTHITNEEAMLIVDSQNPKPVEQTAPSKEELLAKLLEIQSQIEAI